MGSVIWITLQRHTYTLISVQLFKESPHIVLWLSNESTSQTEKSIYYGSYKGLV